MEQVQWLMGPMDMLCWSVREPARTDGRFWRAVHTRTSAKIGCDSPLAFLHCYSINISGEMAQVLSVSPWHGVGLWCWEAGRWPVVYKACVVLRVEPAR